MATPPLPFGERRQLTVVFSDIVGSTELSAQLDPEDWHVIVSQYQKTVGDVVKSFDGHVLQYLGDGVVILFGYPKANENDAERAVRAGLLLVEELNKLNDGFQRNFGKVIGVRVGVHTGEVMVRADESDKGNIFGEAPNVAARVQSAAEPNTVCISAATQRLVAGFFIVEDLGRHVLKGVPEPIGLFKVERASGVRSRLHAAGMSSLTPFVGREEDRDTLMHCWSQAQKGKGQLVMITGEAGIGKSRLLQQFKDDLGGIPHTWIEGESSPYEQDTPFAPTLDLIENAFHWTNETTTAQKIQDLEYSFSLVGMDLKKLIPLMTSFLNISLPPDRYPPLLLSPEQQRAQLLQTLVDWVIGNARSQPTVLVVEDLHFADPSTLEEFVMLGDQIESVPLLLLFTARPRFSPPWPTRPYHTLLALNRLDGENIHTMIAGLLGQLIPKDTLSSLAARTDGVPLFAEELSHAIAESRAQTNIEKQIPASLNDLLMARLDYLGPAKETAQIASVLGRSFSYSLLSTIAGKTEQELKDSLVRLTDSGLVFGELTSSDTLYTFKHALVQESAYGSLLKSRRRELHRALATALDEKFPELVKQRPELVAHHLTEAGDIENAIDAWQKAGDFAAARSAYSEAQRHFEKALKVLVTIPDTPERAFLELPLQVSLGNVMKISEGFGGEEALKVFERARELSKQMGDSVQVQIILLGLWGALNSRSDISASQEISRELLRLAQQTENDMMLTWSYETQVIESYVLGKISEVPPYFELLSEHYHTEEHLWSPSDPKVTSSIHLALSFWQLGRIDSARKVIEEQAELAKDMIMTNVAMGLLGACSLALTMLEAEYLLQKATEMKKLGEENDLPNFIGWGNLYRGAALILKGDCQPGIETLRRGMSDYLATGTHASLSQYLSLLALGYAGTGDLDKAMTTLTDAFGAVGEEIVNLPDLHCTRGDLLAQKGQVDEAETSFKESIAAAHGFGSLTLELRAATHLGRLLQSQGRGSEAGSILHPLFARFTEGFDSPDLVAAKTLLDELSGAS